MSDKFIRIGIVACVVVIIYLFWNCVDYKNDVESNQAAIEEYKKIREIKAKTFILKGKNRNMDMICQNWTALTI